MYGKKIIAFFLLCLPFFLHGTNVNIRIFSEYNLNEIKFSVTTGKYSIIDNHNTRLFILEKGEECTIRKENGKLTLVSGTESKQEISQLFLKSEAIESRFQITPVSPSVKARIYDGNLRILYTSQMLLINNVDIEKYVAGVIQSEIGGSSTDLEFFKIQAIIARTFTIANIDKHKNEDYNLCDGVHCQAYKGRCNQPDILKAANETFCEVIVDADNKIISAAYHSNSGGETMNSEDVWQIPTSYLKSVKDTFSLSMRNSTWEKKIDKTKWLAFFVKINAEKYNKPEMQTKLLSFSQPKRGKYFIDDITLKSIRTHFGLKSTFFSVRAEGNQVILTGNGYGHGVGLSQEGAIKMVKMGKTHEEVIKFYYTGISIIKIPDLLKE